MCVLMRSSRCQANKLDGKSSINHHKSKFTFFYEWSIKPKAGQSTSQSTRCESSSCLMKIVWMKWRLVWALPEMGRLTNLMALKNQQHLQNRVHIRCLPYNHGESVDPARQPALKKLRSAGAKSTAPSKTQIRALQSCAGLPPFFWFKPYTHAPVMLCVCVEYS